MRLIFYIIVAYIVYVIAKKFFLPSQGQARRGGGVPGGARGETGHVEAKETVLDPVCGSYLAKELALKVKKDGKTIYFCGEECRDKFTAEGNG